MVHQIVQDRGPPCPLDQALVPPRHLQRPLVTCGEAVLRQRRADGVASRIIVAVPLCDPPLHHGPDPLAHHPRRYALLVPEVASEQYAYHVGGRDLVDPLAADLGRSSPLGFVRPPDRHDGR